MTRLERLIARGLTPRSYCSGCNRPWFSDRRRPCRCGTSARIFAAQVNDRVDTLDRSN